MATLSSPGIGSGLDINGIVSQLMALERRPLEQLQRSSARADTQLSAFGRLQGAMGTLRDAASRLASPSSWTSTTIASSDTAAVSGSANGGTDPGRYSVSVARLAGAQTVSSASAFANASALAGSGTLTIGLGRWNDEQTAFEPKAGATAVTITIPPGSDSLSAVRDAINNASAGVSASIVNDASGSRLVVRSTETGIDNGFRIGVADDDGLADDGSGLSRLAFDPLAGVSAMTRSQPASNAELTVNGVPISSASNTLSDVLDGMTLKVSRLTTTPVELVVTRDAPAARKMVTDFATAYNEMLKLLRSQTSFDESTKQAGPLQGDRAAVGMMSALRSLVGGSAPAGSSFSRLADIGLEPQRDGRLKVSDSKLDASITRLDDLKNFFTRDETGTTNDGFGVLLRSFADLNTGSEGVLTTRQEALRERKKRNDDSGQRLEQRLEMVEKRLRDSYTRLDTKVSQLSSLQNYVGQQIQNWNRSSR